MNKGDPPRRVFLQLPLAPIASELRSAVATIAEMSQQFPKVTTAYKNQAAARSALVAIWRSVSGLRGPGLRGPGLRGPGLRGQTDFGASRGFGVRGFGVRGFGVRPIRGFAGLRGQTDLEFFIE